MCGILLLIRGIHVESHLAAEQVTAIYCLRAAVALVNTVC